MVAILLALLFATTPVFDVVGQLTGSAVTTFSAVEIESIDHHFVDYGMVDLSGHFVFKKVPEGLYKLIITADSGRDERRTIEVRKTLADAHGKIAVRIEVEERPVPEDQLKIGAGALAISPKARDELRKAYEARGNVEKVREHLQKAIDISPNFDEALNNLGTLYFEDRQFEKAEDLFERALRANPNGFAAQVNLGGALMALTDYDRALTENLKAVAMRPDDSLAQSQTGQTLFHLKRYDEAMSHLELAKKLDPTNFSLPGLFIARIYQIRGEKAAALAEYEEFLKVHPGNAFDAFAQQQIRILEASPQTESAVQRTSSVPAP